VKGGRWLVIACCALAMPLAGCGGESPPAARVAPTAATTPRPAPPALTARSPLGPKGGLEYISAPNPWKEPRDPRIRPHPGAQVERVIVHDVKRGTGPAVHPHDYVLVDYIEANYVTGEPFNIAWGGEPGPTAGVILTRVERWRGFVIGMTGMRVGGRRTIIVPRHLSGTETGHGEFRRIMYWDVVLRGLIARGCAPGGPPCRSLA
jgi:peptidylprolyl isomerase